MSITHRNAEDPAHLDVFLDDPRLLALIGPGAPFEIEDIVLDGVPMRTFVRAPRNILELFAAGKVHAGKEQVIYLDERWTFGQVREQALSLARELRAEFGVKKGDRVAIVQRNYPEFYVEFWAIAVIGAIITPLNSWGTGRELVSTLKDCDPVVAFVDQQRLESMSAQLDELPNVEIIAVRTDRDRWAGAHLSDLVSGAPLPEEEFENLEPDDPVTILYTSGTTGKPKGALGTSRTNLANYMNMAFGAARDMVLTGRAPGQGGQSTSIMSGPLFHIGGIMGALSSQMYGSRTVLMYKWDATEFLRLSEQENGANMGGIPAMFNEALDHPRFSEFDIKPTVGGFGGAATPAILPRRLLEMYGDSIQIYNGYGLTETTAAVVSNWGAEYAEHLDSVGRPNLTADLKVMGADGTEVPHGQIGELCFRSPQNVNGYWNNPKATTESFIDGWFHSGDLGYVTDEGYVYVVDRLKDMVIRSGENVYCAEVEACLFEHPDIADAAVIGLPDQELGERVCAVVITRAGTKIDLVGLRAFCAERIAKYKWPEALYIATEIPRTATGKQAKNQLRTIVADDEERIQRV